MESNTVTDQDPFLALKHGEMVADSLAYSLAPSRTRRPGEATVPKHHVLPAQECAIAHDDVPSKSPLPEELLTLSPSFAAS